MVKNKVMDFCRTFLRTAQNHSNFVKNSIWLLGAESVAKLILFFTIILVARYLGVEGYGKLQFALSFAGIFGLLIDLGFNGLAVRELAREKEQYGKYVPNVFFIKFVLFSISMTIMYLSLRLLGKSNELIFLTMLAGLYVLFSTFVEFFKSLFMAFEKMYLVGISRITYCVLLLLGLLFLIWKKVDLLSIMGYYVFVMGVTFVFAFSLVIFKIGRFSPRVDFGFIKRFMIAMLPFMAVTVAGIINNRLDAVMIAFIKGNEAVGIYSAASNLIAAVLFIPFYCSNSVYPSFCRLFKADFHKLAKTFRDVFWAVMWLGLFACAGIIIFSNFIIFTLFGSEFIQSVIILKILSFSFLLMFPIMLMGYTTLATNNQWFYSSVVIGAMIANFVLNLIFIPLWGTAGAAIATVVVQFLQFLVLVFFLLWKGFFFVSSIPKKASL